MHRKSIVIAWLLAVSLTVQPAHAQWVATPPPIIGPMENPSRRAGTDIHFLAYRAEDQYAVEVGDQKCDTPCTLSVPPGATRVRAIGSGDVNVQLVIPHVTAQMRLRHEAPGWYLPTGASLLPMGLVVAATHWLFGFACGFNNSGCMVANFAGWPVVGIGMFVIGVVLLAIANRTTPADANRVEILDSTY